MALARGLADRLVGWLESPLPPEDIDCYARLSSAAPLPIAHDVLWTAALTKEVYARGGPHGRPSPR